MYRDQLDKMTQEYAQAKTDLDALERDFASTEEDLVKTPYFNKVTDLCLGSRQEAYSRP